MNRDDMVSRIQVQSEMWDIIIIGGGATGMGTAVESASRGYKTLLVEQSDFGKGTSSRSTKLIHGGVRYLQQGNIPLVLESLMERGILRKNAPHLVHNYPFVVPVYDWWEGPFYGIGLKIYDMLAGKHGFGPSKHLSKEETLKYIPTVETKNLRGGVIYYDGQFDDARLIIDLAKTAAGQGATLLNYMQVTSIKKESGIVRGVRVYDVEKDEEYSVEAKAVINATGVFTDDVRRMDDPESKPMIRASQGVHIVLDRSFLPGESAIMVPHTEDDRVLFAVPWHDRIIVGTTDTPVDSISLEPSPFPEELDFLLSHAALYLQKDPTRKDVKSMFAGLRPLIDTGGREATAVLSRDHTIHISRSGLITITGGKWTTYRKMAEDVVDHAAFVAHLDMKPSVSRDLQIHGHHKNSSAFGELSIYGSDAPAINDLLLENPQFLSKLHPDMPYLVGEVIWATRNEMAVTVEDFLARRIRALLLDAKKSIEMAPKVAELMACEFNEDDAWCKHQVSQYTDLAKRYMLA